MSTANEDTAIEHAGRQLFERLKTLAHRSNVRGDGLNAAFMHDVHRLIKEHRRQTRGRGIDFPEVTVLVLTEVGAIEVVRRDLEREAVQTVVVNLTAKYPTVTAMELAQAVRWAFPNYHPQQFDMQPSGVVKKRTLVDGVEAH